VSQAGRQPVRVAAAVLRDAAGRVLITQRPAGKHMAGYWEFPGGKLLAHEAPAEALARELSEELGIEVGPCRELLRLRHDYSDRVVELHVFTVERFGGVPRGLEGQALRWVAPRALASEALLPADLPIVEALVVAEVPAGVDALAVADVRASVPAA
jgi:8-oxo-dGTP diphosphatase